MSPGNLYGLVAGFVGDCCNMGKPAWPLLNMSGAATFDNVSAALPAGSLANSLGGARQLYDTSLCLGASSPHMCMISSAGPPPLDAHGRSKMVPIWRYMLTNDRPPSPAAVAREQIVNCTMAAWQPPSTYSAAANAQADGSGMF
jgi:hypothetical protein